MSPAATHRKGISVNSASTKNKDFLVTVEVTFRKRYIVNASDWEHAEDYAMDEAYGDVFNALDEDCISIEPYEVEMV